MGKFNFEDYRQPWETGPHWELKKEFIETYEDMFEEDRLLCLAQAYANVVLMNCCYPDPVMRQISELSKPLQMRKKFQNVTSSSHSETSNDNEQSRVSEKIKSIYGQTGRPFKQVKFCASKEGYNSEFSSNSTNLSQSSSEELQTSTPLSVPSQQDTQPLLQTNSSLNVMEEPILSVPNQSPELELQKPELPSDDAMEETQPIPHIKGDHSSEDEKIISALGLSFIQNAVEMMNKYKTKIDHPVGLIHCIIERLGLDKDNSFKIVDDPTSSEDGKLYAAKFFIKNCEIASGTSRSKKNAKKLAAENAINTLYRLSLIKIPSTEEMLQLFNKEIVSRINRIKNELALVTIKTVASLLDMDNYITFDVVSRKISESKTEYCCKFLLKDILISTATDNISDNSKEKAAEIGITKLANLSEYEIQNSELKKKHSSPVNNIEKAPFILNQTKFNLSVKEGFVLVEKQNLAGIIRNEKTILYESASFNHKTYQFEFEDVPPSKKAILLIAGAVVGTGIGATKEEAKAMACTQTLKDFKKKYYTLRIKDEYVEGFIITRSQVFDGESFSSNVISESNIGCKMLKSMGWTGGGLGGKGIAEPIQATASLSFGSGLGFEKSKAPQDSKLFRKRLEAMLRDFCKSENYSDLVFSKDFSKEERKEIHQLAGRLHLHTQSRGVGDDRFLTIRQKYETTKLLKFLVKNGGSNSKFELIDDSGTQI